MRIASRTIFEAGTSQLGTLQSQLARTQTQLATQKRILTPSDDPIASARALEVTQSKSVNEQFGVNRDNARRSLTTVEHALGSATSLMQDVKTLVISAGNATMSNADLKSIAAEIEGRMEDLLGIANTRDGAGEYMFSGYKSSTQPFARTENGAVYAGDQGQREIQVSTSRKLAISGSGAAVFESNPTGNGKFETRADPLNSGSGIISTGSADGALTNHQYTINFSVTAAGTSYTVTDRTLGGVVVGAPNQPFKAGEKIGFDGVALDIKGAPADGDSFTVEPSKKRSIFESMTELVTALRVGRAGVAEGSSTALSNALNKANENIGNSIDNVLSVRSSVGARLKEIEYLDSAGDDLDIQYSTTLSELQDLDMVKAITEFTQQQFALEAAQKSFKALSGLSLFNYING